MKGNSSIRSQGRGKTYPKFSLFEFNGQGLGIAVVLRRNSALAANPLTEKLAGLLA